MGVGDFLKDTIGDAVGPLIGAGGAAGQAALNAREAKKQRQWSRKNYKHRFQWSMEDMEKAGLNPILAAGMGLGGGSTPSGAAASIGDMSGVGAQVTAARDKRAQRSKINSEKALMIGQGAKLASDSAKARSDIEVNEETKNLIAAQAGAADAQRNHTNTTNLIDAYGITNAMLNSRIAGKESTEMARTAAEWTPLVNALSGVAGAWGFGRFLSRSPNASSPPPKGTPRYDPNYKPINPFSKNNPLSKRGPGRKNVEASHRQSQGVRRARTDVRSR